MAQRNVAQTLAWYDNHRTKDKLGFDPDGMCLKVVRYARNIPAKYPSALAAALATPLAFRVRMGNLKPGHVIYYDDPNDDNPFGHVGTVRWVAPRILSLADVVIETNSVKANELVKVRGDFFPKNWGDKFQWGASWLNGQQLLMPATPTPVAPAPRAPRMAVVREAIEEITRFRDIHAKAGHTRIADALTRDIAELRETVKKYG